MKLALPLPSTVLGRRLLRSCVRQCPTQSGRPEQHPLCLQQQAHRQAAGEQRPDVVGDGHMQDLDDDGQEVEPEEGEPAAPAHSATQAPTSWTQRAEVNAKTRSRALNWLQCQPLGHLMMLRTLMTPLCRLLGTYIERCGERWETLQRAKLLQPLALSEDGPRRTTRLEEYAQLTAEQEFLRAREAMIRPEAWHWLPSSCTTLLHESQAFRVSSRMGCLVEYLLIAPAKLAPVSTFKLLSDPAWAETLSIQTPCMQDSFTYHFVQQYAEELTSLEALASLRLVAQTCATETVQIEWGHGRVQRLLGAASHHTHAPHLKYINAQWLCHRHSLRHTSHERGDKRVARRVAASKRKGRDHTGSPAKKRRRSYGGGPLRAFISLASAQQVGTINFKELAARYRREKTEGTELYRAALEEGRAATERRRRGEAGFGPSS